NDSESVTCASESRSASIAARSAGNWADRPLAGGRDRASRTIKQRRMGQLYPAAGTTFRRATPSAVLRLKPATGNLSTLRNPMQSEEHTSELQSRGHLVCRLLLEKKKKKR